MQRLSIVITVAIILATPSVQFAQMPAPQGAFAIQHVTVINVETGMRAADQTVVVTGNKITAVGPAAKVSTPGGARVVDGTGKFLIPGIWDMHAHALRLLDRGLPLAVAFGITGIRDMGSTLDQVAEARAKIAKGTIASPRLFAAGPPLNGTPDRPGFPPGQMVTTPEQGRESVDKFAAAKVDMVKIHDGLSRETYFAIAAEAKRKGLPFEGHLPPEVNIDEASDTGQRTVEHMPPMQAACVADPSMLGRGARNSAPNTQPIAINEAKCEATIKHLVKNGTWWTPNIGGPGTGDKRVREFNIAITRMAAKGGVKLLAGTDWPGGGYSFGNYSAADRNVLDEIMGMAEAMTPAEALRAAITNPLTLLKLKGQLGAVERGRLADLDLLDGDPLADIANIKRVSAVVINGRLYDADERKKMLDAEMAARRTPKTN